VEEDQMGHFTWCWNKTIESFNKERIYLKEIGSHKDYFCNFYIEAFYITNLEGNNSKILEYLNKLFDFKHKKSRSELDMLTEIYKMLDQNLKK